MFADVHIARRVALAVVLIGAIVLAGSCGHFVQVRRYAARYAAHASMTARRWSSRSDRA